MPGLFSRDRATRSTARMPWPAAPSGLEGYLAFWPLAVGVGLARRFAELWHRERVDDDLERVISSASDGAFWPAGQIAVSKAAVRAKTPEGSSRNRRLAKLLEEMKPC